MNKSPLGDLGGNLRVIQINYSLFKNTMAEVKIHQSVAILIDGNNIELSLHKLTKNKNAVVNFDVLIPKILMNRGLSRLVYFREGLNISDKLAERLHRMFHGSVVPCYKSADIPLTIFATQIAEKVDTIIILSGCLLYTSPSPRDATLSRMPSSA